MNKIRTIYIVIFIMFASSCRKIETVNPVPSVHFKEIKVEKGIDTLLRNTIWTVELKFNFKDDDGGDLSGININDTLKDTIYSIFLAPFTLNSARYIPYDDTLYYNLVYNYNNNYLEIEKKGQNKTLKGEILVKNDYFINSIPSDTIRYEFYITDLQGNKSNVDTTSNIIFNLP